MRQPDDAFSIPGFAQPMLMSTTPDVSPNRPDGEAAVPTAAGSGSDARRLVEAHLPTLKRIVALVCARHRCFGPDAQDFAQEVVVKLLQGTALQGFRGESRLDAYLAVVVVNCFRDFRVRAWGKWRPSAKARELGATAVRLEELTVRDGLFLEEALETLAADRSCSATRDELTRLAERLPPRVKRRMVGDDGLENLAAPSSAEELVEARERRQQREAVRKGLSAALASASAEDRSLLQLRFWEGVSVADLARMLGVPQRSVYSRFDRLMKELRRALEDHGLSQSQISETLGSWCENVSPDGEADEQ